MRLLIGAIVTAIAGAAISGWVIARTSSTPTGPVILISIDALRADHLGAYGYRRAPTPAIDSLAADGIVFERAYSHSPLTVPAHVSILSGRLPFETGARDEEGWVPPPKLAMLPGVLRRRGFKTAGIVSSALLRREAGLAPAFDFYDDDLPARAPCVPASLVDRPGATTLAVAKRWIDQQNNRFFLFLHLDEPRAPYAPPAKFGGGQPYDGEVRASDEVVGRLVEFLKARDLYDRAIIVLLSDHGEALGEHGEPEHGVFLYESTLRTPLIVKLPKNEGAGGRRPELVQHVDVLPTILDLMGAPRPGGLRGRSLRHLLASNAATLAPAPVYAESRYARTQFGWSDLASVTEGRFRFIRAPRPELYDLLQDRGERDNLAASNPAKAAEMSALLDKLVGAPASAPAGPLTDADLAILLPSAQEGRAPAAAPRVEPVPAQVVQGPLQPELPDPKDRIAVFERLRAADALAARRELMQAVVAYREVLASDRDNTRALEQLGGALLALGQARESLDTFRQAIRLRPDSVKAILGAARALARLGKPDEADKVAAVAAKLAPVEANETRVRLELRRKNFGRARLAAEAARAADPGSPTLALAEGVELYQSGKYDEALPRLEDAVTLAAARPVQTPDVGFYAGDTLARLRRYSDAEARLSDELKWFPDDFRAREALAGVYDATGRTGEIPALAADLVRSVPTPEGFACAFRLLADDKQAVATLRAEARQRFGDAAVRAAELLSR